MLFDRDFSQAQDAITELQSEFTGVQIVSQVVDVTNEDQVDRVIQDMWTYCGSISHLLCFAGIVSCVPAIDITPGNFRRLIDVNTVGVFACAQSLARYDYST